mgnify:CR=1 FL=1
MEPTHPSGARPDREDFRDKAAIQVHLTAIAYNLKRTMNILAAQA